MMSERSPKPNAMYKATRLCQFYLEGRCARGSECTFAHGHEQMKQQPDLYRTALCKEFSKTGHFTNSSMCLFAHGEVELRRSKKKKKTKQPVDHQSMPVQVASPEAIPLQYILPKPGFCPSLDDESNGESRPTFSRQSTDCKSRRDRPAFGKTNSLSSQDTSCSNFCKTSSLSSQDTYASHWPDFNELDALDNEGPCSSSCVSTPKTPEVGKIQLEEEQGLAAKSSWDTEDTADLKMPVKNTFLHFEEVSGGCAEKRSKSCRF